MDRIWNGCFVTGVAVHVNNVAPDGHATWQPLKNNLSKYDGVVGTWAAPLLDNATLARLDGLQSTCEPAHYFRQILHIPRHEACTARKVGQVAYNLGQALASDAVRRLPADLAGAVRPLLGLAMADVVDAPPAVDG